MSDGSSFYGLAEFNTISADLTLTALSRKLQSVNATAGGLSIILPDARYFTTGGPIFTVTVTGNAVDLKDADGTVVVSMAADSANDVWLSDIETAAGKWHVRQRAGMQSASPTPSTFFYIWGGIGGSALASYRYDDVSDLWTTDTSLGFNHQQACSFVITGTGFTADASSGAGAQRVEEATPGPALVWTQKAIKAAPRAYFGPAAGVGGSAYHLGNGENNSDTQRYDKTPDTWTTLGVNLATTSFRSSVAVPFGNFVYSAVGSDSNSQTIDTGAKAWRYDVALNVFAERQPVGSPRRGFCASALVGSQFYIFGGATEAASYFDNANVYEIELDSWRTLPPLPQGVRGQCAGGTTAGGQAVIAGGLDGTNTRTDTTVTFDPATISYRTRGNMVATKQLIHNQAWTI